MPSGGGAGGDDGTLSLVLNKEALRDQTENPSETCACQSGGAGGEMDQETCEGIPQRSTRTITRRGGG